MKTSVAMLTWTLAMALSAGPPSRAADGPIGIDHRVNLDDQGVWYRHKQLLPP